MRVHMNLHMHSNLRGLLPRIPRVRMRTWSGPALPRLREACQPRMGRLAPHMPHMRPTPPTPIRAAAAPLLTKGAGPRGPELAAPFLWSAVNKPIGNPLRPNHLRG